MEGRDVITKLSLTESSPLPGLILERGQAGPAAFAPAFAGDGHLEGHSSDRLLAHGMREVNRTPEAVFQMEVGSGAAFRFIA